MSFERRALLSAGVRLLLLSVPLLAVASVESRTPPALPRKMYSAAEIEALFDRPTNVAQLLTNLKVAMDRDLLIQTAFGDDAVLMKFFSGTAVQHEARPDSGGNHTQQVFVTIDDENFPKLTVRLDLGETLDKGGYNTASGHVVAHMRRVGVIEMNVESIPKFTVGAVRDVFGRWDVAERDFGVATDGVQHVPTIKGTVVYDYLARGLNESPPLEQKRVTYQIKLEPPRPRDNLGTPGSRIGDADEVKMLRMVIWEK